MSFEIKSAKESELTLTSFIKGASKITFDDFRLCTKHSLRIESSSWMISNNFGFEGGS